MHVFLFFILSFFSKIKLTGNLFYVYSWIWGELQLVIVFLKNFDFVFNYCQEKFFFRHKEILMRQNGDGSCKIITDSIFYSKS